MENNSHLHKQNMDTFDVYGKDDVEDDDEFLVNKTIFDIRDMDFSLINPSDDHKFPHIHDAHSVNFDIWSHNDALEKETSKVIFWNIKSEKDTPHENDQSTITQDVRATKEVLPIDNIVCRPIPCQSKCTSSKKSTQDETQSNFIFDMDSGGNCNYNVFSNNSQGGTPNQRNNRTKETSHCDQSPTMADTTRITSKKRVVGRFTDTAKKKKVTNEHCNLLFFDNLDKKELPIICKFRPTNKAIWCLNSGLILDGQIWFAVHEESTLNQMLDTGELKRSVRLQNNVYDATVMTSGYLLVTLVMDHSIWKLRQGFEPELFLNFGNLLPCGIHAAASLCVYVGLTNAGASGSTNLSAHVIKLTNVGSVIEKYEYDKNNKRLFTLPYRIHENINGDVCVVDWIDERNSRLLILHSQGKLKKIYSGMNGDFKAGGITCSMSGNILVCDILNDTIHVLNQLGECLMLVNAATENGFYGPCDLTFDLQNRLWVGCCRGYIYCLQFWDT